MASLASNMGSDDKAAKIEGGSSAFSLRNIFSDDSSVVEANRWNENGEESTKHKDPPKNPLPFDGYSDYLAVKGALSNEGFTDNSTFLQRRSNIPVTASPCRNENGVSIEEVLGTGADHEEDLEGDIGSEMGSISGESDIFLEYFDDIQPNTPHEIITRTIFDQDLVTQAVSPLEPMVLVPASPRQPVMPNIPMDRPSMDVVIDLLEKEMEQLSVEERVRNKEEVQGKLRPIVEDEDLISARRAQMRACLKFLTRDPEYEQETKAFRTALAQNPSYILNERFLLMFLRSERFDPMMAAKRMVLHFNEKLALFGKKLLTEDIEPYHLPERDQCTLDLKFVAFLPFRDFAGRAIILVRPRTGKADNSKEGTFGMQRAFFCIAMKALRDELTQINGSVIIVVDAGDPRENLFMTRCYHIVREAIPMRNSATHYCLCQPGWAQYMPLVAYHTSRACRLRCDYHEGGHTTLLKKLQAFGITIPSLVDPSSTFSSFSGALMTKQINQMEMLHRQRLRLQHRQRLLLKQEKQPLRPTDVSASWSDDGTNENDSGPQPVGGSVVVRTDDHSESSSLLASSSTSLSDPSETTTLPLIPVFGPKDAPPPRKVETGALVPNENDVLWGRGRSRDNPGNIRAQKLVDEFQTRYEEGDRHTKTRIAYGIVERIQSEGGRFLKRANAKDGWTVAGNVEAREKISKFFRRRRGEAKGASV